MKKSQDLQIQLYELEEKLTTLEKINKALMSRVERSVDSSGNSFSVFESNILLQNTVFEQTRELRKANEQLHLEITERKEAERKTRTSLAEKEILLKEIHHRVKNNLQIITSLLNLQSRKIHDKEALAMFKDSQSRVKSMALIHEKLYQSKDIAHVDFAEYAKNLIKHLIDSFSKTEKIINVKSKIENILLGVDIALPCGLIINELVSNAIKYAFPNDNSGEVVISFEEHEDNELQLSVADNGIGFPENLDFNNTDSLGMQLVYTLAGQLNGNLNLETDNGTKFIITFPRGENQKEKEHYVS